MNDAYISVLCQDDKLAAELEACLDKADLGVDFVSPGWDAFVAHLEGLRPDEATVLAFMSLAQLCGGGLDGLMEADAFFQKHDHIHVVLLVEPWVSAERGSVELMTRFRMMLDVHLLDEQLGPLLSEVLSVLEWPGSSFSGESPMQALFDDGDSSQGREGSLPDEAMMSGIYGFSPKARAEQADASGEYPVVTLTLPEARSGNLNEVWLSRLLYSLYVTGFSGSLSLSYKRQEQHYSFRGGVIEDLSRDGRQKLLSAFAWTAGHFELSPGHAKEASFTDGMLGLIYDGICGFVSLNLAAERLQGADIKYLAQTRFIKERADVLQDLPMLQRFCAYCTGARNWSQLVALTWDDVRQVLKMACYALDTDLIVLSDEPTSRPLVVEYTNEVALRASHGGPASVARGAEFDEFEGGGNEDMLASRLQERLERFGVVDAYTIFGLYPTCGPAAVRERYYRLVKSHHPDVLGGNVSPRVKALAELTFIHIKDAYVELLDLEDEEMNEDFIVTPSARHKSSVRRDVPSSADRYQAFIADKLDEALADIGEPQVGLEEPEVERSVESEPEEVMPEAAPASRAASSAQASAAASSDDEATSSASSNKSIKIRPARKRNTRSVKSSGTGSTRRVRLGSGAPAAPTTPVAGVPSTPLPSESPDDGSASPAANGASPPSAAASRPHEPASEKGPAEPVEEVEREAEGDASGAALDSERRRALTARLPPQQHFKNGERLLRAGQYAKAREAFKHASKLKPEDPMYRAHYAWAKYMHDPHEEDSAIALLKECLAIKNGRRVEANLFLARIYKRHNNTKEALKHFEEASKLDKNCTEALRELRLHKMRQDKAPEGEAPLEGEEPDAQDATSKMKSFFGQLFSRRKS